MISTLVLFRQLIPCCSGNLDQQFVEKSHQNVYPPIDFDAVCGSDGKELVLLQSFKIAVLLLEDRVQLIGKPLLSIYETALLYKIDLDQE